MKSSKSDLFIYKTWVQILVLYFIMFLLSIGVPIAACFPGMGFPCYFNALVNYSSINLTQRNVAKHITPTLFLEEPEMVGYITISSIVDCFAAIYFFIGAVAVIRAKKHHVASLTTLSQWISLVGDPAMLIMGIWRLWTIQLYIQTLSYKHIYMSAFIYTIHFVLSFLHAQYIVSKNNHLWTIKVLEQGVPKGTLLEYTLAYMKPISTNLHLFCLGVEMVVFSLSLMMAVGNSFYVVVSDIVFGSINMFLVLVIIWTAITEFYLVKYFDKQYGFQMGALTSCVFLFLPLWRYDQNFMAANLQKAILINVIITCIICFFALLVRVTRLHCCKGVSKVSYSALPLKTKASNKLKKIKKTLKNQSSGPALMQGDSESESDV
nr:glycoprotein M [Macronycteris gammaherpesvirus 1]